MTRTPARRGRPNDPVLELIDMLPARLERVRTPVNADPKLERLSLAAAGVAYGRTLLQGIVTAEKAGNPVAAGVLIRALWESWVVACHLVLNGDEALREVIAAAAKAKRALANAPELAHLLETDIVDDIASLPPGRQLNLEDVERRVRVALAAVQKDSGVLSSYNVLYRTESSVSAHAGLITFSRYLEQDDRRRFTVHAEPTMPDHEPVRRFIGALWLSHGAELVLSEAKISTKEIRILQSKTLERLNQLTATIDAV